MIPKKAIVTGGAGFIGSNLVDKLIDMGIQVSVIDDFSTGKMENTNKKAHYWKQDLSKVDIDELTQFMEGVDVVFHLAALANNKNFPTPETEPTNPLSPYGLQKYLGEHYCKMFSEVYGLDTVSLRYFNVYGERMLLEGAYCLVLGIFAQKMLQGKPLTINNDGEQRRDFTYVGDVVNANILAATHPENLKGEAFNIGNGDNYSVNELADMFGGEKAEGEKVLEPFQTLADNSKAKNILNWNPTGDLPTWIEKYKKDLGI